MREEAHALLENILEKNNETEDGRRVSTIILQLHLEIGDRIGGDPCADHLNGEFADIQISVIVEMVAGKVTDMLLKMIALYRPDCMSLPSLFSCP